MNLSRRKFEEIFNLVNGTNYL